MSGPYGLYMYALETCALLRHGICCLDMVYAVWTGYMLYGHVFLLEKNIWCLLVGEEYIALDDVFLLDKNLWIWKISSCGSQKALLRVLGGRAFLDSANG